MGRLPILMYHSICDSSIEPSGLTVSQNHFEAQLKYLKSLNYKSFFFSELAHLKSLPKKSVIITFDDAYVNQLTYALPLLEKYNFKATFFIPFKFIGKVDAWNTGKLPIMTIEQLKSLPQNTIELGLHSFQHKKYDELTLWEIKNDFNECKAFINKHELNILNVLAYPYGKYPKKQELKQQFFELLQEYKVAYAFRIGNKVNTYPFKNLYEIKRIDIKGEYGLSAFKKRIKYGKLF